MNGYIASLWVCSCVSALWNCVWKWVSGCIGMNVPERPWRSFRYCIACSSLVCHVLVIWDGPGQLFKSPLLKSTASSFSGTSEKRLHIVSSQRLLVRGFLSSFSFFKPSQTFLSHTCHWWWDVLLFLVFPEGLCSVCVAVFIPCQPRPQKYTPLSANTVSEFQHREYISAPFELENWLLTLLVTPTSQSFECCYNSRQVNV